MARFCVVVSRRGREVGRSKPMIFEDALKLLRSTKTKAGSGILRYVEDAVAVKHLPVINVKES